MTPEQFVCVLRQVIGDRVAGDELKTLALPPGRAPQAALLELSAWYLQLAESDRAMLRRVLQRTVDSTMFVMS